MPIDCRKAEKQWQVVRPSGSHSFRDFQRESHTISKVTAIDIVPLIAEDGEKTMDQVAAGAVYLKYFKAG